MIRGVPGRGWHAHLSPFDWGALLSASAVVEAALLLVFGIFLTDLETLGFGVVVAATTAVLFVRRNRLALLVRFVVFADVEFWMVSAAWINLFGHGGLGAVLPPLALATTSAVGLLATLMSLSPRRRERTGQPARVSALAAAIFVVGSGLSIPLGGGAVARPTTASLSIKSARYSSTSLKVHADAHGRFTLRVSNNDLFWHTFTSPDLHVDQRFPLKATREISITAKPGTYRFYCAIPGHAQIGMRGTVTVS